MTTEITSIDFSTKGFFTNDENDNEEYDSIPYMTQYPVDELINNKLIDANEKVINENKVKICFDYPFNDKYIFEFTSKNGNGFTKGDLVGLIIHQYYQMYREEEETSESKVMPMEERIKMSGMLNRNKTNGKYGIWGHDMEDLSLESLYKDANNIWHLSISS